MKDPFVLSTQKELEKLAAQLEDSHSKKSADLLRELSEAVGGDNPSKSDDWAATDIHKVINPDTIAEELKSQTTPGWKLSTLEWIRNSLVLAPLILTWLGISQAANKYEALLNTNKNLANLPFLYLWQQGFNNTLAPPLILSNLAFLDFSLLGLLLVLTMVVTWQANLISTKNERKAAQMQEDLAYALGNALLCLTSRRRKQPNDFAGIAHFLSTIGDKFEQTSQGFIKELEEERKRRGDLTAFTTALEQLAKNMASAADSIQQTNVDLIRSISGLSGPLQAIPRVATATEQTVDQLRNMINALGQLISDQGRWRKELQDVMAAALGRLIVEQERSANELRTLLNTSLGQLLAEQNRSSSELRTLLSTALGQLLTEQNKSAQELHRMLNTSLGQLITEQGRLGQELYNMLNGSLGQITVEHKQWGQELLSVLNILERTIVDFAQTVLAIETSVKTQEAIVQTLEKQHLAQLDLQNQMTAATAEIKNVLRSVHDATPELRSMSVDIDKFVRALREIPNTLKLEMLDPLKHYSSAASNVANTVANIAAGSGTLESAATTIHNAGQYLESVTKKLDGRI